MRSNVSEVRTREDALRLSEIVLESLDNDETEFDPLQGKVSKSDNGSITFMGYELNPEEAIQHIAEHVWDNRKKLNRKIRMWNIVGPDVINCGC